MFDESEEAGAKLKALCPLLRKFGITSVEWEYNGYGDSGDIEGVEYSPEVPPCGLPHGLSGLMYDLAYACLPSGFEVNDGSYGHITLDTETGEVDVSYNAHSHDYDADEDKEDNYEDGEDDENEPAEGGLGADEYNDES